MEKIEIVVHPDNPRERIRGMRLKNGDSLQEGDVYASSRGRFEKMSGCVGIKLGGTVMTWVRPALKEDTKTS